MSKLYHRELTRWLPAEHSKAADGHHRLAVLVEDLGQRAHDAAIGLAARRDDLGHGEARAQRVARPHGLEPADLVAARRAERCGLLEEAVPHEAHHDRDRLPAARDETAIDRALGRIFVGVERLRVVLPREPDDLVLRQRVRRRLAHLSGCEVFEIERHGAVDQYERGISSTCSPMYAITRFWLTGAVLYRRASRNFRSTSYSSA